MYHTGQVTTATPSTAATTTARALSGCADFTTTPTPTTSTGSAERRDVSDAYNTEDETYSNITNLAGGSNSSSEDSLDYDPENLEGIVTARPRWSIKDTILPQAKKKV